MLKLMKNLYDNLDEAKAFVLHFTNFAYFYSDIAFDEYYTTVFATCGREVQHRDYLMHRSSDTQRPIIYRFS